MRERMSLIWRDVRFSAPLSTSDATGLLERILADDSLGSVVFETRASAGRARTLVASHLERSLDQLIRQLVPGTRIAAPRRSRRGIDHAVRLSTSRPTLPLSSERVEAVARSVLAACAATSKDEEVVVQVHIGPRHHPGLSDPASLPGSWWRLLGVLPTPSHTPGRTGATSRIRARQDQHRAGVVVRIGARATSPARRRVLIQGLLGAMRVAESAGVRVRAHDDLARRLNGALRPWRYPLTLTASELACLCGWPVGQGELPATPGAHPRHLPLPDSRDQTRVFARSTEPGDPGTLGISVQDALYHTVMLGPTGAGKSKTMLRLALADIEAGRGVLLIDPKTDLVADVLARIPPSRRDDVVVIDPTCDRPVGVNPLSWSAGRSPEVTADAVLSTFKGLYADAWGPRTEEILTAGLLTLARTPGSTLVDLPLLLTNPAVRRRIVAATSDPLGTDQFWSKYDDLSDAQRLTWIAPVLNKLSTFLVRPHLRAVLGQSDPRFDLSDLLTRRRIVLVALNRGTLGPESARLLGSLVVGQFWPLILSRSLLPPPQRHIISVFIDEVQDFLALPTDLADAFAQARSLGVAFHVAHQYRAQLTPALRAGIDTNARNKIIWGLGATDAADMAKQAVGLDAQDFQLLPRFWVYARTLHHGQAQPWTTAATLPAPPATSDPVELRVLSARRYGQPAKDVEAMTLRRLGLERTAPTTGLQAAPVIGRRPRRTP